MNDILTGPLKEIPHVYEYFEGGDVLKSHCEELMEGEDFPMTIRDQDEWTAIAECVNKGIDAHLEAFLKSTFDNGSVNIVPEEMHILLRRLGEYDCSEDENEVTEAARSLRSNIIYVMCTED